MPTVNRLADRHHSDDAPFDDHALSDLRQAKTPELLTTHTSAAKTGFNASTPREHEDY